MGKISFIICLEVNTFNPFPYDGFNEYIPFLKALKVNPRPS